MIWTYAKNEVERMVKRLNRADVREVELRGRPQMRWMDTVKKVLIERGYVGKAG